MKPNIVMIVSDQHQANVTGCYDNKIIMTPNIDSIAKSGVRFTKAYCDSPLCAPSRASILTGLRPCSHKALYHIREQNPKICEGVYGIGDFDTLGTVFRANGYKTAAFGKLHVHGETNKEFPFEGMNLDSNERDLGFDERKHRYYTYDGKEYEKAVGLERVKLYNARDGKKYPNNEVGLEHVKIYKGYYYNLNYDNLKMEEKYNQDSLTMKTTLDFIHKNSNTPFFLFVGLEKPHTSWILQKKWLDMYNPKEVPLPETLREQEEKGPSQFLLEWQHSTTIGLPDEKVQNAIASYYANVTNMDNNIGRIIDKLKEQGLYDNTILIYTSDHGEMLFEHGVLQKHCHYEQSVRVPLIISYPGKLPENIVCEHPAALIDLFPTLLDTAEIKDWPENLEGESMYKIITGKKQMNPDKEIFSEFHNTGFSSRMLLRNNLKYIFTIDNGAELPEQLYDLSNDPKETRNLALRNEFKMIKMEMRSKVLDNEFLECIKK